MDMRPQFVELLVECEMDLEALQEAKIMGTMPPWLPDAIKDIDDAITDTENAIRDLQIRLAASLVRYAGPN